MTELLLCCNTAGLSSRIGGWGGRKRVSFSVPDTKETRAHYSVQENQHAAGARVQALSSMCYDLL
jgi:hypothetical protein